MLRWLTNVFRLGRKEFASLRERQGAGRLHRLFVLVQRSTASRPASRPRSPTRAIAIVDSDRSALSARIQRRLAQALFPAARRRSTAPRSIRAMDHGRLCVRARYSAALRSRRAARGAVPSLQLNIDATAMTQAGVGGGYIESIVQQETASYLQSRGIESQLPVARVTRAFFNPNLEGVWFQSIDGGARERNHAVDPAGRRGRDPRARARHDRAPSGHADPGERDRCRQDLGQRPRHPVIAAALSLLLVVEQAHAGADRRVDPAVPGRDSRSTCSRSPRSASCSPPSPTPCRSSRCWRFRCS